jgi:hypothetical protein
MTKMCKAQAVIVVVGVSFSWPGRGHLTGRRGPALDPGYHGGSLFYEYGGGVVPPSK